MNVPPISNPSERRLAESLVKDGFKVLKSGWPDLLAMKDGDVRFIEIKQTCRHKVSPVQRLMFDALTRAGLTVEVVPDVCLCKVFEHKGFTWGVHVK